LLLGRLVAVPSGELVDGTELGLGLDDLSPLVALDDLSPLVALDGEHAISILADAAVN
jgi:hypothetical protein